jgi:hypothetical protein
VERFHLYVTTIIVAGATLGAVLLTQYLSRDHVDLRYTLSEPIPLRFGGESGFAVQQVLVANKGDSPAKNIHLKIPKGIVDYQVDKNYATDAPQVDKASDNFEVIYPELAPQGQFRVVLKTTGIEIGRSDLSIRHQSGWAVDAFNAPASLWSWLVIAIAFGGALLSAATGLAQIPLTKAESWMRKAEGYDSWQEVLNSERPFYISVPKWRNIRNVAIQNTKTIVYLTAGTIDKSAWYRFLDGRRPTALTESEWEELRVRLSDKLQKALADVVPHGFSVSALEPLLALRKPSAMLDSSWNLFTTLIGTRFVELSIDEIRFENKLTKLKEKLDQPLPGVISSGLAKQYRDAVRGRYETVIRKDLEFEDSPYDWLNRQDLSPFTEPEIKNLKERAAELSQLRFDRMFVYTNPNKFLETDRPKWMSKHEYEIYSRIAQRLIDVSHEEEAVSKTRQEVEERREKVITNLNETEQAKTRILRQLTILEQFLRDPSILERLEEYDQPFAPGNLAILKRIAATGASTRQSNS